MKRWAPPYKPGGLIFANEIEDIINPSNLCNRSFETLSKRARLPQARFHDPRHNCATLLLSKNHNPKIASEILGDFSIAIILDTRSHILPNMQQSAAKDLVETLK